MRSETVDLEERLSSLLLQIQAESGILDRIVYKGKNQHRRCSYFQYLMKVRRDVKLLISAHLEEILNFLFQVINGKTPSKKIHLLESLKRRKCNSEKHNFQERLLGVARLLSQMVEPMVKAATEISSLLARSFFMGFSLTILALLARLRVLVQQIFLDVVSVFNMVSSISQKEHSVKLNRGGIEVFREYYPSKEEVITLECVWEKDKFILLEKSKPVDRDCGVEERPLRPSKIEYQSIEAFLGVEEVDSKKMEVDDSIRERPDTIKGHKSEDASAAKPIEISKSSEVEEGGDNLDLEHSSPDKSSDTDSSNISRPSPLPSPKSQQVQIESKKRVAFISIRKPTPTPTDDSKLLKNLTATDSLATKTSGKEDSFFDLLTGGNLKDSLF